MPFNGLVPFSQSDPNSSEKRGESVNALQRAGTIFTDGVTRTRVFFKCVNALQRAGTIFTSYWVNKYEKDEMC